MITAKNNLKRYGSVGTLFTPNGISVFDPATGDSTQTYDEVDIMYTLVPLESNNPDFGLSRFQVSSAWFMPEDTDWVPLPGVGSDSYIQDGATRMDIQAINKHLKNNKIIVYEAVVKL